MHLSPAAVDHVFWKLIFAENASSVIGARIHIVITISTFNPSLKTLLPETHALLTNSNLTIHPQVSRIILHGSRGPANTYQPNSDMDLSLIVKPSPKIPQEQCEDLFHDAFHATKNNWQGTVDLDLAVVFDIRHCGLKCFEHTTWDDGICQPDCGVDCFGLYKIGKGFNGLVTNAGIQVKLMYPCLKIWQSD